MHTINVKYNPTGETFPLKAPLEFILILAAHGAKQKCNDAHAGESDPAKAFEKFSKVLDSLRAWTWAVERDAIETKALDLLKRAIAAQESCTLKKAGEMAEAVWDKDPDVAAHYMGLARELKRAEQERLAAAPKVVLDLSGLKK